MQNYIIISIIIAIIIFFLYKKNNNLEHFDNQILNLESLQNVFSTFVNRETVSFNNILAENVNTTTLNENYVVSIDLSSNVTHGDVLRYNGTNKIWQNYNTVYPHCLYLNFFLTLTKLYQGSISLLTRTGTPATYAALRKIPMFAANMADSSFAWTDYAHPNWNKYTNGEYLSGYGLEYKASEAQIKQFDPTKTYKIDCTLYLQNLYRRSDHGYQNRLTLRIKSSATGQTIAESTVSVWPDGWSQVINLKTIQKNLPHGIYFELDVNTPRMSGGTGSGDHVYFEEPAERSFNTNFTIFIQEVSTTLQSPIINK